MTLRHLAGIGIAIMVLTSCAPPPPIDETTLANYRLMTELRRDQFRTAAYLIDLRVDDNGEKYTIKTEVYFSGDSVGIYGRGYFGKGAFKGNIINDSVTIYFPSQNEYYASSLEGFGRGTDCPDRGEALISALSLLSGHDAIARSDDIVAQSRRDIRYRTGRFERTVRLNGDGFPESGVLIDSSCGDSVDIKYSYQSRQFPFYQPIEMKYSSRIHNFHANGYVREQKYNIPLSEAKFAVTIPPSAARLESF